MTRRMAMAAVALVGVFVAIYLALYKMGIIGTLACSIGSCEQVQTSRWATFIGLPVAVWGVGYYLLVLALALAALQERFSESRGLVLALVLLTAWGVVFSAWLTYLELFVIDAICIWCVVSALLALALFVLAFLEFRASRRASEPTAA